MSNPNDCFPGSAGESEPTRSDHRASRRSFLKLAGFSFGGTLLTGCSRALEHKAIPLLLPVEEITPGRAAWYATLCGGCPAGCGVLAKVRDGRPIKLEGNPQHDLTQGGLCAVGQASVLELYDSHRLTQPLDSGKRSTWNEVDRAIASRLVGARRVRFLTQTLHSPTQRAEIERFLQQFPDGKQVMVDVPSVSSLLDAHAEMFTRRALPHFRFDQARVIVGVEADFLGTWISPVEFTRAYRRGRRLDGPWHSHHIQIEGRLSLTGTNADRRIAAAPDRTAALLARLAAAIGSRDKSWEPARRLLEAPRGSTLVVCGSNDLDKQRLVVRINQLLENYGHTIDLKRPCHQRLGSDADRAALQAELRAGEVDALLIAGCNPLYDHPGEWDLARAGLVVSFATHEDETAAAAHFVCPPPHALESWGDAEPLAGRVVVSQPTVVALGHTRPLVESLSIWSGKPRTSREIMRAVWREKLFLRQDRHDRFEIFWAQSVHDGFAELAPDHAGTFRPPPPVEPERTERKPGEFALVLYPKVAMLDGRHAHNPWCQELPDPVSKVVWDNYAALSPRAADQLGVRQGDVVKVGAIELPVFVQPGQHDEVVAIAIGYGRKGTDRFAHVGPDWLEGRSTVAPGALVGVSAAGLKGPVKIEPTGRRHPLACTQLHHSLEQRPIVRETTLEAFRTDPAAGRHPEPDPPQLWDRDHAYTGHHWGMAIDLSACTGCSACVVGCTAENNVPVVGKDEVRRQREMHWIRIDRYYRGEDGQVDTVHQPMLCQQCDNAPCETVCPVLATVHSSEGLNQQVYNRCVGTRYCANNCPYKTRRFNWFDYPHEDRLQNMVLNPDVAVRSRGVMEKCSFCVQRIHEAKAEAKRQGRPLEDGEIRPACMQSCPADAIVFGDLNDPNSAVSRARRSDRHYHVLAELNVQPSVGYLTLVRNRDA